MEDGELQGRMLELLLRLSQIWVHCYAVSLVQEVERGKRVLLRRNMVTIPPERLHSELSSSTTVYLHFLLLRNLVLRKWLLEAVGRGVVFRSWGGLLVKVQLGHQWVAV